MEKWLIPTSIQNKVTDLAHEGHQGLVKTKMLLHSKVLFPFMDKLTDEKVRKCIECQTAANAKLCDSLRMTPLPSGPWEHISVDFAEVSGQYVLIIVDDYYRFPIVELLHSTSAKAILPCLNRLLAVFDRPEVLKSDNGPAFNSFDFKEFAKELEFTHQKVTPLWFEANGEAERFLRTF